MLVGLLAISGGAAQLSRVLKPLPEIETRAPGLAKEGLSVIEGDGTPIVKVAWAASPPLPVTMIV
jgi:hypothetical protein